ncbi:hypothetical protein LHJ74_09735 [Streptomyces sp. N2-109]|uniref:Uncharacterized protein n=1 Tax=Streptomyces gossypii TaxID=2883101 RepID=A0ABT2JQM5_9ACTN|nr:hypothetical protein [Streptomyces gossypii]MCT2590189.1 hypothetical protein [Streptomyces gossypii]
MGAEPAHGPDHTDDRPTWLRRFGRLSRRRRLAWGGAALALALGSTAVTAQATGTWPFDKDRYCWGAWKQDSGPRLLGDAVLQRTDSERSGTASDVPSPDRPQGKCSVVMTSEVPDDHGGHTGTGTEQYGEEAGEAQETLTFESRVTVEFGPVPRKAAERRKWLAGFLDASAVPLPDGVPGVVAGNRGMVVLPKACDVDGRPSAVTLAGGETGDGHLGVVEMPFTVGSRSEVARLMLAVAEKGMKSVGCAPEEPYRVTSPVAATSGDADGVREDFTACRIPGQRFDVGKFGGLAVQRGPVTDRMQTCSLTLRSRGTAPTPAGQFVMVREPRLVALFHGLTGERAPGPDWRGKGELKAGHQVVRADCAGHPTVFFQQLDETLRAAARPSPERVFARSANEVAARIGCAAVAP